jgi:hypothetical protein
VIHHEHNLPGIEDSRRSYLRKLLQSQWGGDVVCHHQIDLQGNIIADLYRRLAGRRSHELLNFIHTGPSFSKEQSNEA